MWLKENVTRFVEVLDGWACGAGFGVFSFLGCFGFAGGVVVPWSILLYPRLYFLSCGINAFMFCFCCLFCFCLVCDGCALCWLGLCSVARCFCALSGIGLMIFVCVSVYVSVSVSVSCFSFRFRFLFLFMLSGSPVLLLSAFVFFACFFYLLFDLSFSEIIRPSEYCYYYGLTWVISRCFSEKCPEKMLGITFRVYGKHFCENFSQRSFRGTIFNMDS